MRRIHVDEMRRSCDAIERATTQPTEKSPANSIALPQRWGCQRRQERKGMTARRTFAQSLSATPLATSYPTTPFSLPPSYGITDLSFYTPSFPSVLRRPVELALRKRTFAGARVSR